LDNDWSKALAGQRLVDKGCSAPTRTDQQALLSIKTATKSDKFRTRRGSTERCSVMDARHDLLSVDVECRISVPRTPQSAGQGLSPADRET
ncbi:hypothetical protein U1Q18_030732, partial [Sarracenia purpurea var. burkii]